MRTLSKVLMIAASLLAVQACNEPKLPAPEISLPAPPNALMEAPQNMQEIPQIDSTSNTR